ncbi:EpsG family protein [Pedobacter suwonensis]|uniref:EpsG family protein n=1 Tax=Pedobacter suwonensis TaxID=332999 RepID=UPI0025F42466|nr:EpsG family protein [uncultured Pedobacter sp.]
MLIYYLVFILSFLFCVLDFTDKVYLKVSIYTLFCLFLIALVGFKAIGLDNDSINYVEMLKQADNYTFLEIFKGDYSENTERGYMLLNKLILVMGGDERVLFILVASATGILNYTFFYKNSCFPFTSLLFYLSFFLLYRDFTQIRYGLSCALVFWSLHNLAQFKYFRALLLFAASLLFHNSAFILIPVLALCFFIKNKYFYPVLVVLSLIGIFYNFFSVVLTLGGVPEHMQIYLEEESGGGLAVAALGFLIMAIYFINASVFNDTKDLSYSLYYRVFALGLALSLIFYQTSIFQRFSYLLFQFGILLLPNMLYVLQTGEKRYYYFMLHIVFLLFFLYYGIKLIDPALIRPYF